ncbi:hypothetical protein Rleg4DRAFT_3757 [Rhizobium leguminosarum bv. trifolii WSM2297]|uniref:Uncharacterized protein n=1 Tax=Rhizobium leguminosarum bv. trifolii WSM2297 TaxID=754762 RepID=J0CQR5_RHILT|nr:hypothetical protein [Rhizobium leguminosarum]EJC82055.1 hypothetical protein Rleg4DRAFT_3757 [Rhizobium leguminosarum bv. trifolii WSM2297]
MINDNVGRPGFLAGVRHRASRLADLEQAGSADTLPPFGRRDPTKMMGKVKGQLISTGTCADPAHACPWAGGIPRLVRQLSETGF